MLFPSAASPAATRLSGPSTLQPWESGHHPGDTATEPIKWAHLVLTYRLGTCLVANVIAAISVPGCPKLPDH